MEQKVAFPLLSRNKRPSSSVNEGEEFPDFPSTWDIHERKPSPPTSTSTVFSIPPSDYDQLKNISRMIDENILRDASIFDYFQGFQG